MVRFHDMALVATGGLGGLRSYDALASAVQQPGVTFGGNDLYPTTPEKAAAYGFFIAEGQAFVEGNKRTASIALLVFLDLNGYDFHQTDEEIEEMFVAVGCKTVDQDEFFGWVYNHAKPKQKGQE